MAATDLQLARPNESRSSSWMVGILGIFLGIVLSLLAIGAGVLAVTGIGLHELGAMLRGGQVHINVDQPTVVRQVRALQRLETTSYSAEKITSGERENPILPNFLAGDRLLLVAHGEVIAGMDLAKLQQADVEVRGNSVSVHLPPAEILTTRLDNDRTRVYSRDTGLFSSPDPNLEGEVRAEAERQLRAAALDEGILKTADTNARQTVHSLLLSLGFANIQIH
ncbi:MAG: DUF4230 domain-containing protein [Candidatus Korobacteraceae bacterium]